MNNKITIIILIFEENLNTILNCIKSVKNFKIIIVDNSGNKKRKEAVTKKFNIYKYFLNKINLGFAKGNNIGIKNCDTEYLLILNPDCIISEESINKLLASILKYENCYITAPTFIDENNQLTFNASSFPEISHNIDILKLEGDICCQTVLGAAMFCKTEQIKSLDMFDENFFIFYEDYDLCRKIYNKKKSVIQIFNATAVHQHGLGNSIKNTFKRSFIINFNMTFSELYYFYKINKHQKKYDNLEKKVLNYFIKSIICLLIFNLNKFVYYFSKILAFYKFYRFIKKIN